MAYLTLRGRRRRIDPLAAAFELQNLLQLQETEGRYNDALTGKVDLRERINALEGDYGQSTIDDTNRRWDWTRKQQLADLASRGLSGSSLRSNVENSVTRERDADLRRVNDNIIDRRINADERNSNNIYDEMRGRTDMGPNYGQLAQLSQGLGAAGYFGGMGGASLMSPMGRSPVSLPGPRPRPAPVGMQSQSPISFPGPRPRPVVPDLPQTPLSFPYNPYRPAPRTPSGLDDPAAASIDRFNQRMQMNEFFNSGYLGGGFGGGGFTSRARDGQSVYDDSVMRQQMYAGMNQPAQQYRSSDPTGDAQRAIAATGADLWSSTPNRLVFPGKEGSFGDPLGASKFHVVEGLQNRGDNTVFANPVTGTGGQYMSFDTDPGGYFGGGFGGGGVPFAGVNPTVALAAARNANNTANMLTRRNRMIQRNVPIRGGQMMRRALGYLS